MTPSHTKTSGSTYKLHAVIRSMIPTYLNNTVLEFYRKNACSSWTLWHTFQETHKVHAQYPNSSICIAYDIELFQEKCDTYKSQTGVFRPPLIACCTWKKNTKTYPYYLGYCFEVGAIKAYILNKTLLKQLFMY